MKWLLILTLALSSCTTVRPWERGKLASRCMDPGTDPLEAAYDLHVLTTREGIRGAAGGGGASCGCN